MSGEAVNALRRAMGWAEEIDSRSVSRADIARREGISRARLTQLMHLVALDPGVQADVLAGRRVCSVRSLLREIKASSGG